jgi:hypothetical protein
MTNTLFRDVLANCLLFFVAMLLLLIPYVNDPQRKTENGDEPPGSIVASITWPEGDADVDLWVMGPGEVVPIGYSNKGGRLWNLLRDDLGNSPDATPLNYENSYTRGAPPGEYVINIHCFRCPVVPQKVNVEIRSAKTDPKSPKGTQVLFTSSLDLRAQGQERTAARFRVDDNGDVLPGSINFNFMPLRSSDKSAALQGTDP